MLKKKTISFLLIICILTSLPIKTDAMEERASVYLSSYSATLFAKGNGKMSVDVVVKGLKTMDQIGLKTLRIEEKYSENGSWHSYDVLHGSDDPDEFYDYGMKIFLNTFYFEGTPGYYYRVFATVYAADSEGSDTGSTPSTAVLCK